MNPFESLGNDPTNRRDEPRLAHPPAGGQLYIARLEKQASFAPTNQEPNIHKLFVSLPTFFESCLPLRGAPIPHSTYWRVLVGIDIKCLYLIIQTNTGSYDVFDGIASLFHAPVEREPAPRNRHVA